MLQRMQLNRAVTQDPGLSVRSARSYDRDVREKQSCEILKQALYSSSLRLGVLTHNVNRMALASRFWAMARWCSKPLLVLLLVPVMVTLGAASIASPQVPGGSIRGVVSSSCLKSVCPQGHSFNLAGVSLKLSGGPPGSASLSTVSDSAGGYEFSRVAAGTYTLEASLEGFKLLAATVTVSGLESVEKDLRMEIEGLHQQIEVRAEAPTISQQSAGLPATTRRANW